MFVAQLDRASDYGSEGYRFESFQTYSKMFQFKNDLYELKYRVFYTLLSFFVCFLTSYIYKDHLTFLFSKPLILLTGQFSKTSFIYTHLGEALLAQLKVCIISSLFLGFLPVLLLNLWLYIVPGLFQYERTFFKNFLFVFFLFGFIGFLFGYHFFIPIVWKFLMSFSIQENSSLNPFSILLEARIKDYIDLTFDLGCLILLVFQVPLIIVILLLTEVLTLKFCISNRRYFLLFSWVLAACVTPPDVLSQALVAIPLYSFIEFTFFIFFCVGFKLK